MKEGTITERQGIRSYPPPPMASIAPRIGELDLRILARKLGRRIGTIVTIGLVLTGLAAIAIFQLTPYYTAVTQVMIEPRQVHLADVDEVLSGLTGERETIESQLRVIASRNLAEKVIAELGLAAKAEFNPALREPSPLLALLNPFAYIPDDWKIALGLAARAKAMPEEQVLDLQRSEIVDTFLDSIEVRPEGRSRVISISATSRDADLAAQIANTLADLYLVGQLEAKFEATRLATEWLNQRVTELREKVRISERAVEEFRRSAGLIEGNGMTVAAQQMSELNTQLILARTQRAEAEARLRQVEALLESTGGSESAAEVLSSPLIQGLREQQAEVERRAAELATEYGPKHPRMINVRAEAADLEEKIRSEAKKIVQSLRNEVGVARARESSLRSGLARLTQDVGRANSAEVRLRALEREAEANLALFENFLLRAKETSSQQDMQQPDARVISRADVPTAASFPRKKPLLAGAVVLAFALAVGVALLVEHLDPGFRTAEQIESATGTLGLGLVPLVVSRRGTPRAPEADVVEQPTSQFAESLRTLQTAFLLSNSHYPPKTILVTSSIPREGKSTISLALARLTARSGKKVLLIDGDLRRPRVAGALGLSARPGLIDVLVADMTWEQAIQTDPDSGLSVLTTGDWVVNPPDAFGSERMCTLLAEVADAYDLVIIDAPPVLAVSDPRILARLVDTTVFVVRWAATPREAVVLAMKRLREVGAPIAGAVLSMVDLRKHARYSCADPGYYHSGRYYAERT